jgi:hypothetical protein
MPAPAQWSTPLYLPPWPAAGGPHEQVGQPGAQLVDADGGEAERADADVLRETAVRGRATIVVVHEERSDLRVRQPGAALGGHRDSAVGDVPLGRVRIGDLEDTGGGHRPEAEEVVAVGVVGQRAAVVGALAVGPPDRADQALGGAGDLQVLPVRLLVQVLGAELDVRASAADGEALGRSHLGVELAQGLPVGVVVRPRLREPPVEGGRAAGVGAHTPEAGVLELAEQDVLVLERVPGSHPRSQGVEDAGVGGAGVPPLAPEARFGAEIDAVVSALPEDRRLPVEAVRGLRRGRHCQRRTRTAGEDRGERARKEDGKGG